MPQHPRFFHGARLLAFALAVSLTGACNDSTGPGRRVNSVDVSPTDTAPTPTMPAGTTQQLTATARDAAGNVLTGRTVTWSTSANLIATVSASGVVSALSPGTAVITATTGGRSGSVPIVVVPPVASVTVSPASATLAVGASRDFTATARDAAGNVLTGRPVTWGTSDPNVATVSATGVVTATGEGTATITATVEGRSGTATVTAERIVAATITAGGAHTCALTTSGAAYCWGDNRVGQLGDGSTNTSLVPVPVAGGHTFAAISAGWMFTVALTPSGQAWSWGDNDFGQLGDGTQTNRSVPVPVAGGHTFTSISAGYARHVLALKADRTAWAWGSNVAGQLGGPYPWEQPTPVPVTGGHTWQAVSAGGFHSLGLTTGGQAYAWGRNSDGQLGLGVYGDVFVPQPVTGGHTFMAISAGDEFSLALDAAGKAWSWGRNSEGQLGDGTVVTNRPTPGAVANNLTFVAISAGGWHSVALAPGGVVYGWGRDWYGQLGDGVFTERRLTPVAASGGHAFQQVDAGGNHTCAVTGGGAAYCWGLNYPGQLGAPTTQECRIPRGPLYTCSNVPLRVTGTPAAASRSVLRSR